tara:strand:- start:254 stop:466 length:213 start_codon:yes stop_codon:yes gene_type:complete
MEKITKLISIQNKNLLESISDHMFDSNKDKLEFINKYHKYNYQVLKVSKNDKLLKYSFNRIINIQSAFDL